MEVASIPEGSFGKNGRWRRFRCECARASATALNRAAAQHCKPAASAFLLSRSQACGLGHAGYRHRQLEAIRTHTPMAGSDTTVERPIGVGTGDAGAASADSERQESSVV
jgi:hypothetical protein